MATRAGRPASQHRIPPVVTAIAALGVGFFLVHLFTRSGATAETAKGDPTKPATPGTIQEVLGEGGTFLTNKLGLAAPSPIEG